MQVANRPSTKNDNNNNNNPKNRCNSPYYTREKLYLSLQRKAIPIKQPKPKKSRKPSCSKHNAYMILKVPHAFHE